MADSRKRIALKPHMDRIREWVETGKTDDWIAVPSVPAHPLYSPSARATTSTGASAGPEPESVFEESSTTANATDGACGSTLPSLRTRSGRSTGRGWRPSS